MIRFNRIHISEGIDVNKTSASNIVMFITIGIF